MIYGAHFNLHSEPFKTTPDVSMYYPTASTGDLVNMLNYAIHSDAGIVTVIGEVGTGKTLLCRRLLNALGKDEINQVAYLPAPSNSANAVLKMICKEFGIDVAPDDVETTSRLQNFLISEHGKGKTCVVVIDEAHSLNIEGLEAVRLISNLETEKSKLLQVVLFGQTELSVTLDCFEMRQLKQRIVYAFLTGPMTLQESIAYIEYRVQASRVPNVTSAIFNKKALAMIAKVSGGVPRLINIIAQKSLMAAFGDNSPEVRPAHVAQAVQETPSVKQVKRNFFASLIGIFRRLSPV